MARLGKRERLAKRTVFTAWRDYRSTVVSNNLSSPKPKTPSLSRDETAALKLNSHTRGISIGQRDYTFLRPGSMALASNKRKF